MNVRTTLLCAALVLAAALAALPGPAQAESFEEKFIQPGRGLIVQQIDAGILGELKPDTPCTIGFILVDPAGRYYATTAGHCRLSDSTVSHPTYGTWGVFLWDSYVRVGDVIESDLALIHIYDAYQNNVDPSVRFWGGPTGVAAPASLAPGVLIAHTGFPLYENPFTSMAGQARSGPLLSHDATMWHVQSVVSGGDSGSPFIDVDTGLALGGLSGLVGDFPAGANFGNDLARIHAAGWPTLTLATAPYVPA